MFLTNYLNCNFSSISISCPSLDMFSSTAVNDG